MRIAALARLAALTAATLLTVLTGCTGGGRIDTGSAISLPNGGSAHLSVEASSGDARDIVPNLRDRISQELLAQNVFSKVAVDASPTDVIVHVEIVDIAGWEGAQDGAAGLIGGAAEVRTEVEVVDAANAEMLGRFSASGSSAAGMFGGRKSDALDAVAREIARFLASG